MEDITYAIGGAKQPKIYVEDIHYLLTPYKFNIFLRALEVPDGITIKFDPQEIKPGHVSNMMIYCSRLPKKGEYEIIIRGFDEDGKTRNCIFVLIFDNTTKSRLNQLAGNETT